MEKLFPAKCVIISTSLKPLPHSFGDHSEGGGPHPESLHYFKRPEQGPDLIAEEQITSAAAVPDRTLRIIPRRHEGGFEEFIELAEAAISNETVIGVGACAQHHSSSRENGLPCLSTCEFQGREALLGLYAGGIGQKDQSESYPLHDAIHHLRTSPRDGPDGRTTRQAWLCYRLPGVRA